MRICVGSKFPTALLLPHVILKIVAVWSERCAREKEGSDPQNQNIHPPECIRSWLAEDDPSTSLNFFSFAWRRKRARGLHFKGPKLQPRAPNLNTRCDKWDAPYYPFSLRLILISNGAAATKEEMRERRAPPFHPRQAKTNTKRMSRRLIYRLRRKRERKNSHTRPVLQKPALVNHLFASV